MVLVKPNGPCVASMVEYSVEPGHTYTTRDGIVLGRDTIAEASEKLKGRIDSTSYMSAPRSGQGLRSTDRPARPSQALHWHL